ncbi:Uncharacterised protein [Raoultella terrigena]|uniref:Uncharacterized protein n=1 Tax=Raoultella terrigena TaxID=577 RepID=A0A4V6J1Y2_RAOTE|nr:Uncharacterised protein [Raoultella terrigena]
MTQDIRQYHAGKASALRVGDVVDRIVTVDALDALPAQIPPLLYAIAAEKPSASRRLTRRCRAIAATLPVRVGWSGCAIFPPRAEP